MTQIRKATVDDVPALTRMVAAYWEFDDIPRV
jgi:N-acetylglutamate synthase-like GNAT family acetyltransferase